MLLSGRLQAEKLVQRSLEGGQVLVHVEDLVEADRLGPVDRRHALGPLPPAPAAVEDVADDGRAVADGGRFGCGPPAETPHLVWLKGGFPHFVCPLRKIMPVFVVRQYGSSAQIW